MSFDFGWKLGLATLTIDIFKGLAGIRSVDVILPFFADILIGHYILAGSCVILGHFMPIWLNWKGGKAVATPLGVILGLLPSWFSLIIVGVFVVTYVITRKVSLGSLTAAVTAIFAKMFFGAGFNSENYELSIFIIAIVVLIIFAHR
jgi:glycerol-3-phosphate acyltransferase PlsY